MTTYVTYRIDHFQPGSVLPVSFQYITWEFADEDYLPAPAELDVLVKAACTEYFGPEVVLSKTRGTVLRWNLTRKVMKPHPFEPDKDEAPTGAFTVQVEPTMTDSFRVRISNKG